MCVIEAQPVPCAWFSSRRAEIHAGTDHIRSAGCNRPCISAYQKPIKENSR